MCEMRGIDLQRDELLRQGMTLQFVKLSNHAVIASESFFCINKLETTMFLICT